ncbi:hypothetical protein D9Q98_004804 [Chlorella vulgaris]|uniref:Queuosine 5'-phosphate N-glycosylase/hydrolase n=1 Tax=Chlorella vulgaris TaxID=3077 RepID=A0A9D4YXM8_CHLVU|nr:hypothetical protein D9Q98_004804 [Chlorella vulgaris]
MVARETVLLCVNRTCLEVAEAAAAAGDVLMDTDAVSKAAAALPPPAEVAGACRFLRLPIRFQAEQEVNAMALFHLLDFGSGFDSLLLAKSGRDAAEAVQYGLLGMLLHGAPVDSRHWMEAFSGEQVFQFFGIDATEDEPVAGLPGVMLSRQGPLGAFTGKLKETMNEGGRALAAAGQPSLGALVLSHLDGQVAAGQPPSAAALVEALAEAVPSFDDRGMYRGTQVYLYRKAQALAQQLHLRFRGSDDRFKFVDTAQLAADSGNVLPSILRRQGVLKLSDSLAAAVDGGQDLQGDEREVALRAAAVAACAAICRAAAVAGGDGEPAIEPWQLSMFLLRQEEQCTQRLRQGQGQAQDQQAEGEGAGATAGAQEASARHVACGTTAY